MYNNYLSRSTSSKQQDSGVPKDLISGYYAILPSAVEEGYITNLEDEYSQLLQFSVFKDSLKREEDYIVNLSFLQLLEEAIDQEEKKEKEFIKKFFDTYKNNELIKKDIEDIQKKYGDNLSNLPFLFDEIHKLMTKIELARKNVLNVNNFDSQWEKLIESSSDKIIFSIINDYFNHTDNYVNLPFNQWSTDLTTKIEAEYISQFGKDVEPFLKEFLPTLKELFENFGGFRYITGEEALKKIKDIKIVKKDGGKTNYDKRSIPEIMITRFVNGLLRGKGQEKMPTLYGGLQIGDIKRTQFKFSGGTAKVDAETDTFVSLTLGMEPNYEFIKLIQERYKDLTSEELTELIKNSGGFVIRYSSKDQTYNEGTEAKIKGGGSFDARIDDLQNIGKNFYTDKEINNFIFTCINEGQDLIYSGKNKESIKRILTELSFNFMFEDIGDEFFERQQRIKEGIKEELTTTILHMYYISGAYYPASFILKILYEKITSKNKQIGQIISITPLTFSKGNLSKWNELRKEIPASLNRWNKLRDYAVNNTSFGIKLKTDNIKEIMTALRQTSII